MPNELKPLEIEEEDDGVELAIEKMSALVGPVLKELFAKAELNEDYWLKKKSVKHLARWIQSVQDVTDVMYQANQQMQVVISAQEEELQKLRPEKKNFWIPGGG